MCTFGSSAHAALRNSFNPDPDSMIMDPKHRIYCMCDEFHWNNVCCYWEMIVPPGLKKGKTQIGLNNAVQCMSWNYVLWFSFSFQDNIVHSPLVRDFYWNRDGSKSSSVISSINALLFLQVELDSLLTDEQLANCPVLILGNKIDRPGAAGEDELR